MKSKAVLVVLTSLAVLGSQACVDDAWEPGDTHEVRRQEIRGGTVDSTHTSVVGILIDFGGGDQSICSGTLIAPNLVLTAQHCVAGLTSQFVVCGDTPFGAQYPASTFHVTTQTAFGSVPPVEKLRLS